MVKRWWWVGALVIVALGVIAYAVAGGNPGTSSPGGATGTSRDDTVALSPTPGATSTAGNTSKHGSASTPGTLPARPTATKPGSKQATETVKLVPKGSKLTTVTAPPSQTLAQIRFRATRKDQMYDVVVRPYGTGPGRAGHDTVVVVIDSSKAQKTYKDAVDLNGMNALLELGPKALGSVQVGGTYRGVVRLMQRGDVLVLVLVSAKPQ